MFIFPILHYDTSISFHFYRIIVGKFEPIEPKQPLPLIIISASFTAFNVCNHYYTDYFMVTIKTLKRHTSWLHNQDFKKTLAKITT